MSYVYRMLDNNYNVLYVGYSGREDLNDRMKEHLSKRSNVDNECIDRIARIDYKKYRLDFAARSGELRYIKEYNPRYNIAGKKKHLIPRAPTKAFIMDRWEVFKELQPMNDIPEYVRTMQWGILYAVGIFGIVSIIYMLYSMYFG